jgi:serine/threonine protein kinase
MTTGTKVGTYEILAPIGAGGMGEVYRARDTKLKRDVALKVLPGVFANDLGRMARFQREAEVLASLNHPNIAHIYGVEDRALVMEPVEGQTLSRPIPIDAAIDYAGQIAEALEYAHERGVIHRDLKPANIKVTPEGIIKLLDFGLAKAIEDPAGASEDPSNSPTLTLGATRMGVIMGTAAYMSPEQASGKAADRRADIWSFGAILYEMLAGRKAFEGESVSDTLASVLKVEPDWKALAAATPPAVRKLIRRCLTKDRKQRLQAIGEARIVLQTPVSEATPVEPPWHAPALWIAGTAACLLAFAVLAFVHFREVPSRREQVRFQIPLPPKMTYTATRAFSISPDGRKLVFVAANDGVSRLWLRSLDSLEFRPLPGTENVGNIRAPIWSPDSRLIAFDQRAVGGKLKKISIEGGPAENLCDLPGAAWGGSWSPEGVILFGSLQGIMWVSSSGWTPIALTALDPARLERRHSFPMLLPDGRHFLYLRYSTTPGNGGIYVGSLDAKPEQQSKNRILATDVGAVFVPPTASSQNGRLLFLREGTLLAQTFDVRKLELAGEPVTVAEHVGALLENGNFSASANGTLVYLTGASGEEQLRWYDRQGKIIGTVGDSGEYYEFALAPDGIRVAVSEVRTCHRDIWILDSARGNRTRLTSDPAADLAPRWSPNGTRVVFTSDRAGHMDFYTKDANSAGAEELLSQSNDGNIKTPTSWSRDGRYILFTWSDNRSPGQLMVLPLSGDRKPFPYLPKGFGRFGDFSPDGRWVTYESAESGRREVYVRPFPMGGQVAVSTDGGMEPRWSRDGKGLFFRNLGGRLMVVSVTATGSEFREGTPHPLFDVPAGSGVASEWFEVSPDAKRFLFKVPVEQSAAQPLMVVLNWDAGLKK